MVKLIVHAFNYLVCALRRTWSGRRNGDSRQCPPGCKVLASPLAASSVGGASRVALWLLPAYGGTAAAGAAAGSLAGDLRHRRGPSRHPRDGGAVMNSEEWEGSDLAADRSPFAYPPCECGEAECPDHLNRPGQDKARATERATERDSPVIKDLRARVREENRCRRKFGRLG